MTRELLRQVRVIDPVSNTDRVMDVLIAEGQIEAISEAIANYPADTSVQDCTGLILGPGLVDLYSHSGEPGNEERETIQSFLAAGEAGGFTRLTLLPDTHPATDTPATLEWFRSRVSPLTRHPQLHHWAALTLGTQGEKMAELAELAAAGIAGFTDGKPLKSWSLLRRSLEYGQPFKKPFALWCCDRELASGGVVREGTVALRLGLPGVPAFAETAALAALLECVASIGTPVHLMRVSTARAVELIRTAKAQGLPITASTTWMHLLLDINSIGHTYDSSLHLAPPLGNPVDRAALIQGLQEGVLDAIAIDHSPYTYEEKTVAFAESPPGAIGLEFAFPLLWQRFVATGEWSALLLWRLLSTQPALCLQQSPSAIAVNTPAELMLYDPKVTWEVTSQTLKSRSTNTPWLNQEIVGRVVKIWV
jgi:dihydroorotase